MRVVSWNMKNATAQRIKSWNYLSELNPNIALLQEINSIPDFIKSKFKVVYQQPANGDGTFQKFGTAIFIKGEFSKPIQLISQFDWVNEQLNRFAGIFVAEEVILENGFRVNVVSVHSPAWKIDSKGLDEIEKGKIKLKNNRDIWGTELLWSALANIFSMSGLPWIIGGDFNTSTLFDLPKNRGNQEALDRMNGLGLRECLLHSRGILTPTFKNARNKELRHQIDYLFVSLPLIEKLKSCAVEKADIIFEKSLSDHLPIIADFEI